MTRLCSIEGCGDEAKKRGFCKRHYGQWYRREVVAKETRRCSIDGCDRPFAAKGLCQWHHRKMRLHGDPLGGDDQYTNPSDALAARTVKRETGCVEWTGSTNRAGYGSIKVSGRTVLAHRASYEINRGPIPDGQWVLHRCDNPPCVNPDHLFLGDAQANVDDMMTKGRGRKARGEGHGAAKLTEEQVRAIRADPRKVRDIAPDYGIGKSTVSYIKTRKIWGHVE